MRGLTKNKGRSCVSPFFRTKTVLEMAGTRFSAGGRKLLAGRGRSPARRAFTLLEVMIAVGILFMCLFGVMALLSNSLVSARKLQQHRTIDTGTVAGMIYVQLINTNQITEGPVDVDLEEMYPGCKCDAQLTEIATNGLCQIDFLVERNQRLELQSHFLMYLPNLKQGGISATLPHH